MKTRVVTILVRVNRIAAWGLLAVMPVVIVTGYGVSGDYEWTRPIASAQLHGDIHRALMTPKIALLAVHAGISAYLAVRRWRRKRRK